MLLLYDAVNPSRSSYIQSHVAHETNTLGDLDLIQYIPYHLPTKSACDNPVQARPNNIEVVVKRDFRLRSRTEINIELLYPK